MKSLYSSLMALCFAALFSGCSHPIKIAPDSTKLPVANAQSKVNASVGYFISEENRALRVTTPAGGGDSVTYAPYADLEPGLKQVLGNVFSAVYLVQDTKDQSFLKSNNISYIFKPTITTNSSSRNHFFWPPTDFSVTLECSATDAALKPVWSTTVKADNDLLSVKEIIKDHGLSGKSAATKALSQLQIQLQSAQEFRK